MKKNFVEVGLNRFVRFSVRKSHAFNSRALFLVEYPKSGASWMGEMLAATLEVPFPRNQLPTRLNGIFHGHYLPKQISRNSAAPLPLLVTRDPRDVLISWYFHSFFVNERYNERHVKRMKKELYSSDYDLVRENLSRFIVLCCEKKYPLGFNWSDFHESWRSRPHISVSYEEMKLYPSATLRRLADEYGNRPVSDQEIDAIVERYSFHRASGRGNGNEDRTSFVRKGIIGDYKNYFSAEDLSLIRGLLGDEPIHWGYNLDAQ